MISAAQRDELLTLDTDPFWVLTAIMTGKDRRPDKLIARTLNQAGFAPDYGATWTPEKVRKILKALPKGQYHVQSGRQQYELRPEWEPVIRAVSLSTYPEDTAQLARAAYQVYGYQEKPRPATRWRYSYYEEKEEDFKNYPHRLLLLELAGDTESYQQLLNKLFNERTFYYSDGGRNQALQTVVRTPALLDAAYLGALAPQFRRVHLNRVQLQYDRWTPPYIEHLLDVLEALEAAPKNAEGRHLVSDLCLNFPERLITRTALLKKYPELKTALDVIRRPETNAGSLRSAADLKRYDVTAGELLGYLNDYGNGTLPLSRLKRWRSHKHAANYADAVTAVFAFIQHETGETDEAYELLEDSWDPELPGAPFQVMVFCWCAAWTNLPIDREDLDDILALVEAPPYPDLPWVQAEIFRALALHQPNHTRRDHWQARADALREQHGFPYFADRIRIKAPWEKALQLLDLATAEAPGTHAADAERQERLLYIVDMDLREIQPKVQKQGKKGWTKGRKENWATLYTLDSQQRLHDEDRPVLAALYDYTGKGLLPNRYYSPDMISYDFGQMLYQLADHPRVVLSDTKRIPLEIKRGTPELTVTESETGLEVRFVPGGAASGYFVQKETPTRYTVYRLTEAQAKIAKAIGKDGVEVPLHHRTAMEERIEKLRNTVSVQSSTDWLDENLEEVAGDPKPAVHLLPHGEAYKLDIYSKPIPDGSYYFKPGEGMPRSVVANEEGRRLLVRDLSAERAAAAAVVAACPTLKGLPHEHLEWQLSETKTALQVLLELRQLLQQDRITLEHPRGEKLRLVSVAGSDAFSMEVGKNRDWFGVTGRVKVDENRVLDLQDMLERLRAGDQFIQLADGEFMALTDELRERVLAMEGLLHKRGKKLELPALAASQFAELAEDLDDVEYDAAWQESLDRIAKAQRTRPRVPDAFAAELRDYQQEGFRWLMRLAAWGVGGCLADDMGLGKTVQALAVLTARAGTGPGLVIAPASVTRNWINETKKFAPSLTPVLLASRNEVKLLDQIDNGTLLLVSYGLLPFVGEELAQIRFGTVVLDEAQAIKNAATKRAKTVQLLQADFKIATTGTPIENHLGELWSLFRFLNPGLLGSKELFNEKFDRPITRNDDAARREQLRRLVQPFILRRRKDEVLTELPPKTEIVLDVELSDAERNLYEAMRRQAVQEIDAAEDQSKRFVMLAQLTKLRQAACHPRLVRKSSRVPSAKLALVGETILEILDNGHKALVFSQFVQHLKIVEHWVKHQNIPYQYLDGSTPGKARQQRVNAFQRGEGALFLISLKAGGTGLNLTAADYVLHLDPWWNPAVEDQASDRAHRIGQQRPVTVYRFVSQHTIEEKIIALHEEKRDLADQILSGTNKSGKLGVDEVLAMLKEGD